MKTSKAAAAYKKSIAYYEKKAKEERYVRPSKECAHVFTDLDAHRAMCSRCGAYSYKWVEQDELLRKLNGKRKSREKVREPSYAPPELFDFTKTDLVDLVWRLAEREASTRTLARASTKETVQTIATEYLGQKEMQKQKPPLPKRMIRLIEKVT